MLLAPMLVGSPTGWLTDRLNPLYVSYAVVEEVTEQRKTMPKNKNKTKISNLPNNNSNIDDKKIKE